jgi:hypothetical protein
MRIEFELRVNAALDEEEVTLQKSTTCTLLILSLDVQNIKYVCASSKPGPILNTSVPVQSQGLY